MYRLFTISVCLFLCSCDPSEPTHEVKHPTKKIVKQDSIEAVKIDSTSDTDSLVIVEEIKIDSLEQVLIDAGLKNVQTINPDIMVDLKYSSTDNFLGKNVYGNLQNAYLQEDVAIKLSNAQDFLTIEDSSLHLLVYDAVRPRSVQQMMWDILDMPMHLKVKFVSNPLRGSIHNYGAAVDLTIVRQDGTPLDMGAGFDDPSFEAWPIKEKEMLDSGKITLEHISNRKLLRKVMGKAGFFNIQSEWWHFNSCYRNTAKELYDIIE